MEDGISVGDHLLKSEKLEVCCCFVTGRMALRVTSSASSSWTGSIRKVVTRAYMVVCLSRYLQGDVIPTREHGNRVSRFQRSTEGAGSQAAHFPGAAGYDGTKEPTPVEGQCPVVVTCPGRPGCPNVRRSCRARTREYQCLSP